MEQIKQIPYGVSDFRSVIEQDLYYVDKSMYIEELERQSRTLIFIRPRRFGKSLFLNMMRLYYDKAAAGDFERLFGGLYIGQHPTPNHNRYQVLYMNFSFVGGGINSLVENSSKYFSLCLNTFMRTYESDYPDEVVSEFFSLQNYSDKLTLIVDNAKKLNIPLYLIIDDYDDFSKMSLDAEDNEVYHAITQADEFYLNLFKKFNGSFDRIVLTGLGPVTFDGYNDISDIGWKVSTKPELNKMLGFTSADVKEMFLYYKNIGMLSASCDIEAMSEEMRLWYGNFCFAEECIGNDNTVFDCASVLYYLNYCVHSGHSPAQMLNPNICTNYGKLNKLVQLDKIGGDRKGLLTKVILEGQIVADLRTSFSAMDMTDPEFFPSILFCYGMLTITGRNGSHIMLGIPNNSVRKLFYRYLLDDYRRTKIWSIPFRRLITQWPSTDNGKKGSSIWPTATKTSHQYGTA